MKSTDKPIILNQSPSVKNPPAFPLQHQPALLTNEGMTLRDYFAAASLTGIKSNPELCRICSDIEGKTQQQEIASMAYTDADAMLQEREKWQ
jgi:hypothetical protein